MRNEHTILVTGATGTQGGAVTRRLLATGYRVRALVRDPNQPPARTLQALGAELALGDLDDVPSLQAATQGVHGVFSVQPADLSDPRPESEVRRGMNVADAADAEQVQHLVYSSVAAAHRDSGVAHFEAKERIEAHLETLDIPVTVLRPVFFMENFRYLVPPPEHGFRRGTLALEQDTTVQLIAADDIGRIAAETFTHPGEFTGRAIEIAGDELTVRQIARVLTDALDATTRFEQQPIEELRAHAPDMAAMYQWISTHGYRAEIAALRDRHPELLTFDAWARMHRKEFGK